MNTLTNKQMILNRCFIGSIRQPTTTGDDQLALFNINPNHSIIHRCSQHSVERSSLDSHPLHEHSFDSSLNFSSELTIIVDVNALLPAVMPCMLLIAPRNLLSRSTDQLATKCHVRSPPELRRAPST